MKAFPFSANINADSGLIHVSMAHFLFTPNAGKGGLDLLLEAGNQFTVSRDQCLLGFDLGDDRLLDSERRQWNLNGRQC